MGIAYNSKIVTSGLVLCLDAANSKSYPGSGNTWINLVGSSNMTLTNGPTYTSGQAAYFTFDGVDDWANNTTQILSGDNTTPFTLEAVAMTTTAVSWQTVLGTQGTFRQIGFNGGAFYWGGNGGGGNTFVNGGAISANAWYHMAFTFDGTTGYGYLNTAQTTGSIGAKANASIGSSLLSSYTTTSAPLERLTGRIAIARIYNRALSASEISQNYSALRGRYGV